MGFSMVRRIPVHRPGPGLTLFMLGNAGVSRTSVGEFAANNGVHQGRAFSIFGLCTAMGTLLGPLLGGFLCQPTEKYGFTGPAGIFAQYPYLLPCAISACYNIILVVFCIPYLEETNLDISKTSRELARTEDEETPLIAPRGDEATLKSAPKRTRSLVLLIGGHALVTRLKVLTLPVLT